MTSFFSFLTTKKFPSRQTIRTLLSGPLTALSVTVYALFFALCGTLFALIVIVNNHFLTTVPARGGNLAEGVIGAPHSINPLLATTATDQRLVALVYGSLMKTDDNDNIVPSLATDYSVSPDGTTYTVTLAPKLHFDDGKPLTSEDVVFTVQKMQDNSISTASQYWQNITVENPDPTTVVFTLPAPDTSFINHLTFGILPEHIWHTISDEDFDTASQNLKPVGAGTFKVTEVTYSDGIPTDVVLKRNKYVTGTPALLRTLTIKSFANQTDLMTALNDGDVDFSYSINADSFDQQTVRPRLKVQSVSTDQTVALYHSSQDNALSNPAVIAQIEQIIDKNAIIATVQHGYGTPAGATTHPQNVSLKNVPSGFSIAVENDPALLSAAQTFADQLQHYGITVSIRAFDPGIFQQYRDNGTFSLFLARSNDEPIPSRYSIAIPLYTESLPYVFTPTTHTIIANTLESPATEYDDVRNWYTHTDRLWKIFNNK